MFQDHNALRRFSQLLPREVVIFICKEFIKYMLAGDQTTLITNYATYLLTNVRSYVRIVCNTRIVECISLYIQCNNNNSKSYPIYKCILFREGSVINTNEQQQQSELNWTPSVCVIINSRTSRRTICSEGT